MKDHDKRESGNGAEMKEWQRRKRDNRIGRVLVMEEEKETYMRPRLAWALACPCLAAFKYHSMAL